ncbi:hypothetical protein J4440_01550 [Candidatus Woesearchaeota archaeon]|nr:hypothetical protein [Candidatus Woesearchaeota archaeon]
MIVKNLEVSEIILTKVNSKSGEMELTIKFTNDSPLIMNAKIDEEFESIINKIIKTVKTSKVPKDDDQDGILGGITIVNLKNEEELKEKLPKRFIMLDNRLNILNKTKTANEYMKLFSQVSTMQEILYQKNNTL